MARSSDQQHRQDEAAAVSDVTPVDGVAPVVTVDCSAPGAPDAIRDALRTLGCFYAVGIGVKRKTVAALLARSRDFFSLPVETKMKISSDANFRGYTPMSDEKLGGDGAEDRAASTDDESPRSTVGDLKEGVYFGRDLVDVDHPLYSLPLHGPNRWPHEDDAPGYKAAVEASFEEFRGASVSLMRLVASALGVGEDFFVKKFSSSSRGARGADGDDDSKNDDEGDGDGSNIDGSYSDGSESAAMDFLRTLHYAPRRSRPELGELGAGAHRDYGFFTLLVTDGVPGLQVSDGEEEDGGGRGWRVVPPAAPWPPVNGVGTEKRAPLAADPSMLETSADGGDDGEEEEEFAVFVNGGDMLHRWSNGAFESALHRVALSSDVDRYSAAFFFDPPWSCVVEPITAVARKGGARGEEEDSPNEAPPRLLFEPTTYGEYLVNKFKKTHASFDEVAGGEVERRTKKEREDEEDEEEK